MTLAQSAYSLNALAQSAYSLKAPAQSAYSLIESDRVHLNLNDSTQSNSERGTLL
jgi:hypothetical protein